MNGAIRAVIADDEPLARQQLKDLLAAIDWVSVVGEAGDGTSTIRLVNTARPDVLFLDIRMPAGDGLQVLRRITHHPHVIFTTAFDRYAVAAFELQALDYLLKPFGARRLQQALERVRQQLPGEDAATAVQRLADAGAQDQPLRRLYVRIGGRIIPLGVERILHCEARGDYVAVHTSDGSYIVNTSVEYLARRLSPDSFARIHRSRIVNLEAVEAFERHDDKRLRARLKNGAVIIASRAWSRTLRGEAS
ncbi:MAG TPA: LytTR family DNA-binding domain-containing protein [Gemmatimonadales bacterium]|jgi:two-component system LytT family response regulator